MPMGEKSTTTEADAMAEDEEFQVSLVWEDADERAIVFANQFLIQHQPDEFILSVGHVAPPPFLGTEEERREQLARLNYIPIRVLGRFGMTRRRLVELISVLQANLERHDEMMKRMEKGE